jgi:hypothetical protein
MRRLQIGFAALLVVVAIVAVTTSLQWGFRTRVFPLVVGVAAAAFALVHLAGLARPSASPVETSPQLGADEDALPLRASMRFSGWLLLYAGCIWAFGFMVGGIAVTLVYMLLERRESPLTTALMCTGLGVMLWALDTLAGVGFPPAALL